MKIKQQFARLVMMTLLRTVNFLLRYARNREGKVLQADRNGTIMLTGTFHSSNWIQSHIIPLTRSSGCRKLYIISPSEYAEGEGINVIRPSKTLQKVFGGVISRTIYFVYYAYKYRPEYLGGFHLLFNGMIAITTAKLLGLKSIYFCVGGPAEVLGGGINSENRLAERIREPNDEIESRLLDVLKSSDLIITMGTSAKQFYSDRGVDTRIEVISGGIDGQKFCDMQVSKEFDFIFSGRLAPIKRVDIYIDAINQLKLAGHDPKAVIIGDGELRTALESQCEALSLQDNITFAGMQSNVESWLNRSKVFVMTSDSEGLSLSLMEAMMCGLPAVVSNVGDLGDVVKDGENGFLIDSRSPSDFAKRMGQLVYGSAATFGVFRDAAKKRAWQYEVTRTVQRWDALLG